MSTTDDRLSTSKPRPWTPVSHVVLRPVRTGDEVASEVTMTSDLEHGRRVNLFVGGGAVPWVRSVAERP